MTYKNTLEQTVDYLGFEEHKEAPGLGLTLSEAALKKFGERIL